MEIDKYIEEVREVVSSYSHIRLIWNGIMGSIPLDVANEGQLGLLLRKWGWIRWSVKPSQVWNKERHYRLLWAEREGFDQYLNKRLKELVEHYFKEYPDSFITISHIKDYYRNRTMRRHMKTFAPEWPKIKEWDTQAFNAFRKVGSNYYYAMTPFDYVLEPLIREISTQEIIEKS